MSDQYNRDKCIEELKKLLRMKTIVERTTYHIHTE